MQQAGLNGVYCLNKCFIAIFSILLILISGISIINAQCINSRASSDTPEIEYLAIDTIIDNNYATTKIQEMFRNPYNYSVDETFTFQIPEKAFISNFSLTIDNTTHYAKIVPYNVGKQKYEEAVISGSDAGLMEAQGKNIFSYSVSLSPYQEIIVGLEYEQFLEKSLGGYEFLLPLKEGTAHQNIKDFTINILLKSH